MTQPLSSAQLTAAALNSARRRLLRVVEDAYAARRVPASGRVFDEVALSAAPGIFKKIKRSFDATRDEPSETTFRRLARTLRFAGSTAAASTLDRRSERLMDAARGVADDADRLASLHGIARAYPIEARRRAANIPALEEPL